MAEKSDEDFPNQAEQRAVEKFDEWFEAVRAPEDPEGRDDRIVEPDTRLLMLCMTPRSGSTALSATLASIGGLGLGGERLNRNSDFLRKLLLDQPPRTKLDLLRSVIRSSRTSNGVGQIKCDLWQLIPFLLDPDCFVLLSKATFAYLTREDLASQAVSRYRGFASGIWHSDAAAKADTEVPYDFDAIDAQYKFLVRMMNSFERTFAHFGIDPVRFTYESMKTDLGSKLARLAEPFGVSVPEGVTLDTGGFRTVSGSSSRTLRDRYVAEVESRATESKAKLEAAKRARIEARRRERQAKAEAAERARIAAEKVEIAKAEAAERARIAAEKVLIAKAEAAERAKRAAEAEQRAKAEAAERARIAAEKVEIAKAEAAERARIAAEKVLIAKAEAAERARIAAEKVLIAKAEAAERAKRAAEAEQRAKAEEAERARIAAEIAKAEAAERIDLEAISHSKERKGTM